MCRQNIFAPWQSKSLLIGLFQQLSWFLCQTIFKNRPLFTHHSCSHQVCLPHSTSPPISLWPRCGFLTVLREVSLQSDLRLVSEKRLNAKWKGGWMVEQIMSCIFKPWHSGHIIQMLIVFICVYDVFLEAGKACLGWWHDPFTCRACTVCGAG